jgi:hypothetical protein
MPAAYLCLQWYCRAAPNGMQALVGPHSSCKPASLGMCMLVSDVCIHVAMLASQVSPVLIRQQGAYVLQ